MRPKLKLKKGMIVRLVPFHLTEQIQSDLKKKTKNKRKKKERNDERRFVLGGGKIRTRKKRETY